MKDSTRKVWVLLVLQCSHLIDEIYKEIIKENLRTYIESLDKTLGCLLWMDDMLLIASEAKELQQMLNIPRGVVGIYNRLRKTKHCENIWKYGEPRLHPRGRELQIQSQVQVTRICANSKEHRGPHQSSISESIKHITNPKVYIAGNKNFNNEKPYGNTKLHNVNIITQ